MIRDHFQMKREGENKNPRIRYICPNNNNNNTINSMIYMQILVRNYNDSPL